MVALNATPELDLSAPLAIKVLDLQTRRYHAGFVHTASDGKMEVELAGGGALKPGSRIRYSYADAPFVASGAMRFAVVKQVARMESHMRVALAVDSESAAA